MVLHLHKKQKNVVCKSIQPPESILCWTTFRCNDSCKSFWVSLYQRCTCKIAQALPEILKLIWSGLWLGHSNTWMCFDLNHSIVALAACLVSLSFWKVTSPVSSLLQNLTGFLPRLSCIWLHPSSHQLRPASLSLLKKSIPTAWCCHDIKSQ